MKPINQVIEITGASARDIDNWLNRFELKSKFAASAQGRARVFSRENVIELAVIAELVRHGAAPRVAVLFAASVLRSKFGGGREYLMFANLNFETAKAVSYTHLRAHETGRNLVCRLLLEK